MKFESTKIAGVWLVTPERRSDDRGCFARTWCEREFATQGLNPRLVQCNTSFNRRRGTLRGLHYQAEPHGEAKLVRCTRGRIYDVAIDLRTDSPTFKQWAGFELNAENGWALYLPAGCAHGFQTLEDNSEVFYQMSEYYYPELARGVRWNDPALAIIWPLPDPEMSERDRNLPPLG